MAKLQAVPYVNPKKRKPAKKAARKTTRRALKRNPAFGKRRTGTPKGQKTKKKSAPVFGKRKEKLLVISGATPKARYYWTGARFDTNRSNAAFYRSPTTAGEIMRKIRPRLPAQLRDAAVVPA